MFLGRQQIPQQGVKAVKFRGQHFGVGVVRGELREIVQPDLSTQKEKHGQYESGSGTNRNSSSECLVVNVVLDVVLDVVWNVVLDVVLNAVLNVVLKNSIIITALLEILRLL